MTTPRKPIISVPPGAFIERNEKITVDFLSVYYRVDITFLVPDRRFNVRTPDVEMMGLLWEIKCPVGKSLRTVSNVIRKARRQSCNIILDLRGMSNKIPTDKIVNEIKKQFYLDSFIKRIIIITKENKVVEL